MSIHPRYAEAIMTGVKTVEFRKKRLASDISRVLVYATAPEKKVIGHFVVERIVVDSPNVIWKLYGQRGVIDRASFFAYYSEATFAVAILVAEATHLKTPIPLSTFEPQPPVPQSFAYLPAERTPLTL